MTQLELIPLPKSHSQKRRKSLLGAINKRRQKLQKLVLRTESLKVKLDMLKREYMVKIGSLVVRDNHLDLDIIRLRNLLSLMEEGLTFKEATDKLASTYYAEQLEIEEEEENIRRAERIFEKGRQKKSEELQLSIKKLWRKLITKYHPDLTQDLQEKTKREEIIKQINLAYEEGDLPRLSKIERDNTILTETPTEDLEDLLGKIENEILEQEKTYANLRQSEWYKWHSKITKSQKTMEDIFSGVEKKLIADILAKINMVKDLQQNVEHKKSLVK